MRDELSMNQLTNHINGKRYNKLLKKMKLLFFINLSWIMENL